MAGIRLERLEKRFGDVVAVCGIDLDVPDGRITVLVGPSGCGKTTTLRMIAGLEEATGGRILIGGRDVTPLEPKDRDLAMVFQNYALYPHMSAFDNIAFGLKAKKMPPEEIRPRVRRAAELLGIGDLLDRKPRALSGGQQQRVAIGRAIVREPAAFLFDEPLSNLDAKLRVEMRTEILKLQRELGSTIVYVTHDQEEAMTLADEMVVMRAGVIAQRGRPADVYRAPANVFVAAFVGSPAMNIVAGEIDGGAFRAPGLHVPAPGVERGATRLGVRPEHIRFADSRARDRVSEPFRARVEVVELLGANAVLTLHVSGGPELKALVPGDSLGRVAEGAEESFAFALDALHLFSGDGERRLA